MKVSIDMHRSKQQKKCIQRKSAVIKKDLYKSSNVNQKKEKILWFKNVNKSNDLW